jgi:hypothetical protein
MSRRFRYAGTCHCGNIEVTLASDRSPAELGTRTDTCSFCAKHGSLYTSDPAGELVVAIRDAAHVQRYRFGTKTADFLICTTCGTFVAATMDDQLAVVNINVLAARAEFLANPIQVADLDGETLDARLARRRARWTPLRLSAGARG